MRRWISLFLLILAGSYAGWKWWQMAHEGARDHEQWIHESTWSSAYTQANSDYRSGHFPEAAQKLEAVLPQTEQWWPNSSRLFETLYFLGGTYRAAHNYDAAEPILKRALALGQTLKAPDSTELGRVKFNLAVIARDKPDDVESERLFDEALDLFARNPHAAQGDDGTALLNLGALCKGQGRYAEAESFLTRSITAYAKILGENPQEDFANSHFLLAEVYRLEGRNTEAIEEYQKALAMDEKVEGPNGQHVQYALTGLAIAQSSLGRTAEASQLLDRGQSISRALVTSAPNSGGATLNDQGLIAQEQHNYVKAEALYTQACATYEKAGGTDARGLATALANLGNLYRDHEGFDISKAEPLLKRALSIREKALGPEHADVAETLSDLSLLYFYEKKAPAAKQFALRALPMQEKIFGTESLEASTTLNRLGIAERDLGEFAQAETDLKHALAIREKRNVPKRTWIAISLENLASVYIAAGEDEKAAPLIARARAIRSQSSRE